MYSRSSTSKFRFDKTPGVLDFHRENIFRAGPPDCARLPLERQIALRDKAILKALLAAQLHPRASVACKLAFPHEATWVTPVNGGMVVTDVYAMDKLVIASAVVDGMAKKFKKTGSIDPDIPVFQTALDSIAAEDPAHVSSFRDAVASNDLAEIEIGFVFLKLVAINQIKTLFDRTNASPTWAAHKQNSGLPPRPATGSDPAAAPPPP